jgi:hypothetical protein
MSLDLSRLSLRILNQYIGNMRSYVFFLFCTNYFSRNHGRSYVLQVTRWCPSALIISVKENGIERPPTIESNRRTWLTCRDSELYIRVAYKKNEFGLSRKLLFRRPFNHLLAAGISIFVVWVGVYLIKYIRTCLPRL